MASKPPKVRFVKCPKCKQILPEFANVPVYKCGGCDLVLRAKYVLASGNVRTEEPLQKNGREDSCEDDKSFIPCEGAANVGPRGTDISGTDHGSFELKQKNETEKHLQDNYSNTSSKSEHDSSRNIKPQDFLQKNETDYKREDYDPTYSNKPPLTPISAVVDASHLDFTEGIESVSSNPSISEDGECSRKVSSSDEISNENEDLAQVVISRGEPGTADGESIKFKNTECASEGREDGNLLYQNFVADEVNYLHDSDQIQHNSLEPAQIRQECKMEDTESVISEDMLEPKLSAAIENLSKSPTTISSRAYYSSLSSNGDDYDSYNPSRGRNSHLSRRTLFRPRPVDPMGMEWNPPSQEPKISKITANSTVEPQVKKMTSVSSYERYGSAISRYSDWNQDEQLGSRTAYGNQAYGPGSHLGAEVVDLAQSHMDVEPGGASRFPERVPNYYLDIPSVYEKGNLSDHVPREFDNDQMELIKKVERLRDHLSRLEIQRGILEYQYSGSTYVEEPLPLSSRHHRPLHPHSHGAYKSRMIRQSRSSQLHFSGYRHHLECSCSHCCFDDWQYPSHLSCDSCCSNSLHHAYSALVPDHYYSPTTSSPQRNVDPGFPLTFHNNSSAFLGSRLLDNDIERLDNKGRHRPFKRHCRPIAGGAPFIMCYSCWKLLQLPADFLMASKRCHKLQCGACSEVLTFSLLGKTHVVPQSPAHDKHPSSEVDNGRSTYATAKDVSSISQGDVVSYSDEYGLSFCKSYSTEGEHPIIMARHYNPDSGTVDKTCESSTSARPMEKRKILSSEEIAKRPEMVSTSAGIVKVKNKPQRTGSQLHRLMGFSSPRDVMNKIADDPNSQSDATSQMASEEYLAEETLMTNGLLSIAHVGLKSGNSHLEKDKDDEISMRSRNMRDSSLTGRVKKGFKNINHGLESTKQKVHVNGRLIPEQFIKKAEEKAGPIRPGDYWYDYRAGFWGVMGKPCLGIIPPLIEEFSSPMAKDSSGGNTSILVNGRELHEDDFELLLLVGLPATRTKAYIIDASGLIIDETSGKELGRLDKLAPTIEKTGHGFGMLDPSLNTSS